MDPWLLLILGALWVLGSHLPARPRQSLLWFVGILAVVFVSPFCALGSSLFTARTLHHLVLILCAAPLLARSAHVVRPPGSIMTWVALQAVILWFWHWPVAYEWALSSTPAFWFMQLTILFAAATFWLKLRDAGPLVRIAALGATMAQMSLLGALLTFAPYALYRPHWLTTAAWDLTPLADQQLAGVLMWIPAGGAYLALLLIACARMLADENSARQAQGVPGRNV
jgi:putative membrane protein